MRPTRTAGRRLAGVCAHIVRHTRTRSTSAGVGHTRLNAVVCGVITDFALREVELERACWVFCLLLPLIRAFHDFAEHVRAILTSLPQFLRDVYKGLLDCKVIRWYVGHDVFPMHRAIGPS